MALVYNLMLLLARPGEQDTWAKVVDQCPQETLLQTHILYPVLVSCSKICRSACMLQGSTADAKRAAWVGTGMAIAVLAALAVLILCWP